MIIMIIIQILFTLNLIDILLIMKKVIVEYLSSDTPEYMEEGIDRLLTTIAKNQHDISDVKIFKRDTEFCVFVVYECHCPEKKCILHRPKSFG